MDCLWARNLLQHSSTRLFRYKKLPIFCQALRFFSCYFSVEHLCIVRLLLVASMAYWESPMTKAPVEMSVAFYQNTAKRSWWVWHGEAKPENQKRSMCVQSSTWQVCFRSHGRKSKGHDWKWKRMKENGRKLKSTWLRAEEVNRKMREKGHERKTTWKRMKGNWYERKRDMIGTRTKRRRKAMKRRWRKVRMWFYMF